VSDSFPSRVPVSEAVLLELRRSGSAVRVGIVRWPSGRSGIAISFVPDSKAAKFVNLGSDEVRRVAAALAAVADAEGW
jgi:hypothetical protein